MTIKTALLVSSLDCLIFHPLDTIKTRLQTDTFKQKRFGRLYSGLSPAMLNIVPKVSFRLVCFDKINEHYNKPFMSGMLLGCFESIFITGPTSFYKNNKQICNKQMNTKNLFKSIPLVMYRQMLSNALFFGIYNTYKTSDFKYNIYISAIASLSSTFISYPIGTIQTKLQTSKSTLCFRDVGYKGLYKGFSIKLFRGTFGKMFVLSLYDIINELDK